MSEDLSVHMVFLKRQRQRQGRIPASLCHRMCISLCLLMALYLLPSADAKLRFPFPNQSNTAGASSPSTCTLGEELSGACPVDTGTAVPRGTPLLEFWEAADWERLWTLPWMQLPIKSLRTLREIALYQPPMGIVSLFVVFNWVRSGKLWKADPNGGADDPSEQALSKKATRMDRHVGRALDLDADDMDYQKFGGVERVRRRLLGQALADLQLELMKNEDTVGQVAPDDEDPYPSLTLVQALRDFMQTTFPPNGSHAGYIQEMMVPMAMAEASWFRQQSSQLKLDPQQTRLCMVALQTAELRMLDSLLRLTRDRLLRTCFRLSKTVQHWRYRVETQNGPLSRVPIVRKFMAGSYEGDRVRLAFAESAFRSELERLGRIVGALAERPGGLKDSLLQKAVQRTLAEQGISSEQQALKPPAVGKGKSTRFRKKPLPASDLALISARKDKIKSFLDPSNWSIFFNADGRGKIQVQKYDDFLGISGKAAAAVILEDDVDQTQWLATSREWSRQSRKTLHTILEETIETSILSTQEQEDQLKTLKEIWCENDYKTKPTQDDDPSRLFVSQWDAIFRMARDMSHFRRVGDGKSVKWKDANVIHWFRQFDLLGVPSVLLKVFLAQQVHSRLVPYWPQAKSAIVESYEVSREIVLSRFWNPFRDLFQELMSRDTDTLLMGISIEEEETSLDYMLRDLSFGDGTPDTRNSAIVKATRQYESDMNNLMLHAIGGRLIRLILIQVQQLKVGMLHAADTVDVLLQTNRFNLQLLAVIPAIVIVTVGTKVLTRFLFSFRHKDIRPMAAVHGEMSGYLNELESVLLLASESDPLSYPMKTKAASAMKVLSHQELGSFVLNLYDYLLLLDYSSPQPFPSRECNDIHRSITEFLGPDGSLNTRSLNEQIRWIGYIKERHVDLKQHL